MKDFTAFMPHVFQFAPGCAEITAIFHLRQAAIQFCERTRLWRYEDTFTIGTNGNDALFPPEGSVVHEINAAFFEGDKLEPVTTDWLDEHYPRWQEGEITGRPQYITQTEFDTLQIVPQGAGEVRLELRLKPSEDADQVPDFLADHYAQTIARGALASILLIPNQSFTSADMAAVWSNWFEDKLAKLSPKGTKGQQRAPLRTKASLY